MSEESDELPLLSDEPPHRHRVSQFPTAQRLTECACRQRGARTSNKVLNINRLHNIENRSRQNKEPQQIPEGAIKGSPDSVSACR